MLAQDVIDILGLDSLLAQMILALGLAMVLGNGYAIYMHRQGKAPEKATGEFHAARAYWLLSVGTVIALWGGISLAVG